MMVEPTSKQAKGGPVMMRRRSIGDVVHILVMPNGERRAQPPTAAQIRLETIFRSVFWQ
jgi:hypothetical protein